TSGRGRTVRFRRDIGQENPVVHAIGWWSTIRLRRDGAAAAGREPFPHALRRSHFLRLAHLGARLPRLGALRLARALGFLLRPLQVLPSPPFESVVAAGAQPRL